MKPPSDRFRDPTLGDALDAAIAAAPGARAPLYDKLRRAAGLPGPRMNDALVRAFAAEVARRGAAADGLLAAMRALHPDVAPFGHVDEFLAILGTAGVGARAATDATVRSQLLENLKEDAADIRSRVRDEVSRALGMIALAAGPGFARTLVRWVDDDEPYLARAVAAALKETDVLLLFGPEETAALVDAALARVHREHRGGRRHDSYRRLVRELEVACGAAVTRHPTVADVLERHAATDDEDVRGLVEVAANALRKGRVQERAAQLDAAIAKTKKPSRDPRWDRLPGKRGRGKR